jgi:Domain of unknown function (DUF4340)
MRGLKSTLALFLVLVGLGTYIYFVTWKKTDSSTLPKKDPVFAGLETPQIDELTVKSQSGEVTTLKKSADKWQIFKPIETPAAESDVAIVTSAIGQMEINRVVDEKPADLKEYGLDPPKIEVEFKANGGKTAGKVFLGDKTPTGGNLYAKKADEPRVFLVADYLEASLSKTTFDLRDKGIVKVERDKVDSLELTTGGKSMQFARSGSDWSVAKPIAARADFSAVDGLVGRVETAQMKSIVTENPKPEDLKKYGLDKPDVTVTIGQGSARAVIALGGASGTDAVYARDLSKPLVVTIDKTLAEDLKKGLDDFRRKDAFEFRAFNATNVEFARGDQKAAFERVKGQGENATDSWKRVSPTAADSDKSKVESLLAGLADIRATAFTDSLAKTGLDKPVLTVSVKFEEGKKEEKVSFGRNGSDAYALIPGQPGAGKIEAEKLDEAIKALDELSK